MLQNDLRNCSFYHRKIETLNILNLICFNLFVFQFEHHTHIDSLPSWSSPFKSNSQEPQIQLV